MGDDSQLTPQALNRLLLAQGTLLDLLYNQLARHQPELAADLLEDIEVAARRGAAEARPLLAQTLAHWRQALETETRLRQAELRNSAQP